MTPCTFTFDESPSFQGFAHGSTWNGFDNVAVTRETHATVLAWLESDGCDAETLADMHAIEAMENGLISYGWGYATQIDR